MSGSGTGGGVARRQPGEPPLLIVGAMNFGGRTTSAEAERIVSRALERGLIAFDTANSYNDGESERILGRALRGRRHEVHLATKVGLRRTRGRAEGLSRERVLQAIDESLTRLGVDHVDLYYLHAPDPATPVEETLDAINTILDQGKIGSFGVSNFASWQVLEMIQRQDAGGRARAAASQVLYNLLIRQLDVEYAAFARRYPVPTAVYNPLAGGLLAGRYEGQPVPPSGSRLDGNRLYQRRYWTERMLELVAAYRAVAAEAGMSLLELSYAWLARREVVDAILLGPATVEHLDAAIDACQRPLPADVERRIEGIHAEHIGTDATYAR
ncbi:aldo/keto reductase [Chondromyces crocatus]|uniref:Aldo/keto reductase n=1 Tax=Chondromyces crocatus TaxID=52 RepID=A0A0K1ES62_CHOCO|nr:aldo/keto reductase [Chondromyces crocatus]AKT43696.1 aldo/keto reductase [Chondromyces crocatus]